MASSGLRIGLCAALIAVAGASLGCQPEPERARPASAALPGPPAIHTEVHRRQLVTRLDAVTATLVEPEALPTLCRGMGDDEAKALLVSKNMLRALHDEPPVARELPPHELGLNAEPFLVMLEAQRAHEAQSDGADTAGARSLAEAIGQIAEHRYLAVVEVQQHRAPSRRGDRTITKGRIQGELILVDADELEPLCRATITAETSNSMTAYGAHDAKAFADDLRVNFLRAVETQLSLATGGMKLAAASRVSPRRLASHAASSPSASPP